MSLFPDIGVAGHGVNNGLDPDGSALQKVIAKNLFQESDRWADARLSCSYCNYTLLFALTATKAPRRAAEVLGGPLAPQGTPSARTAEETKRNGRFRAALVARCRHMWAGRPLGGLRASATAL